ncbi:MAG: radical SAM protein [Deltaproteobacteria bacterium]|nr:radical SAM protein [Deltaproteobacteria bacterium]MCB9487969.1 radical SAM protein [Deltaproteobacteria bacterium]
MDVIAQGSDPTFFHRFAKHARYIYQKPHVMRRAAENYARMILMGQKRLSRVEFALNFECFAKCEHCSIQHLETKAPKHRPPMDLDQIKDAVRQFRELGTLNINLTGGEVLLLPYVGEVVEAADPRSTVVTLATNGVPVTKKKAKEIADWGISIVTMSIDSSTPDFHDANRKVKGCWERMIDAIELLRDEGVEVYLNTVLTRENMDDGDIFRMIELAVRKKVMLTVNPPMEVGGWEGDDLGANAEMSTFFRKLMKYPNVRWEGSTNYFKEGCMAGIEKLYISHFGDVMPCNFTHLSFGNMQDKPLSVIWHDMITNPKSPFNRIHDHCLIAEDPEFMRVFMEPVFQSDVHPLPIEDHPAFQ